MRHLDQGLRWGTAITVVIGLAVPRDVGADPDPALRLMGTSGGVEMRFAIDHPNKGCTYGALKNLNQDDVEIEWGYEAVSETGARKRVEQAPDAPWPLAAGQSVGGWAAILWCPFNKNFDGDRTESMVSLRLINVKVRNLGAERREQERLRQEEEDRKRREQEEVQRLAEQKQRREDEARRRQDEAKQRQDEAARREAERQRRIEQGFKDQRDAQEANRKLGDSSAAVAVAVFGMQGGNEGTQTTTRALQLGFGFGGRFLPHMANTSGGDAEEESTTNTGGGFAFDGSLAYWPRYLQQYGVGFGAEGGFAGMALPGGGMYALHAGLGVKGYYGNRTRWTIVGELDLAVRLIGSSANLFGAIVSGSSSYNLWRLGVGPSFCKTATATGFCETRFYALLLRDWTSGASGGGGALMPGGVSDGARRTGTLLRLGAISKYAPYGMGLELELGFGYPAHGETKFQIEAGDEDRAGIYFVFSLRKAWTWHSGSTHP